MELKFSRPFHFQLEVVETDERTPSMRVAATITLDDFRHSLCYVGKFWLLCADWDRFADNLNRGNPASLADIDRDFLLEVVLGEDAKHYLQWALRSRNMKADSRAHIDDDMLADIKIAVSDFIRWWAVVQ